MQGLLPSGNPLLNPQTGLATGTTNPGDPVTGLGWLDNGRGPTKRSDALPRGLSRWRRVEPRWWWGAGPRNMA